MWGNREGSEIGVKRGFQKEGTNFLGFRVGGVNGLCCCWERYVSIQVWLCVKGMNNMMRGERCDTNEKKINKEG